MTRGELLGRPVDIMKPITPETFVQEVEAYLHGRQGHVHHSDC